MLKTKTALLCTLLSLAMVAHAETFTSVTVENNLTVGKSASMSGNLSASQITGHIDVVAPIVKTNQVQAPGPLTLQVSSGNIEMATQLVNVWGGISSNNSISSGEEVIAKTNVQAGGSITAGGSVTAKNLNFTAQKMCSGVSAGEFRTGIIVPNTWTSATCSGWIIDQKVANQYQLGCVTSTGVSYGPLGGGNPADNSCGW